MFEDYQKKICHLISQHVGSKELEIKLRNQQFECGETMEIEKKDKDVKKRGELYWPGPKKTTRQTKAAHHGHISTPKQTMNTLWHAVFDPQFWPQNKNEERMTSHNLKSDLPQPIMSS